MTSGVELSRIGRCELAIWCRNYKRNDVVVVCMNCVDACVETTRRQLDMWTVVGQNSITLPCHTSAGQSGIWWYQHNPRASIKEIFNVRGDVMNGFKRSGRFTLQRDARGDHSLVIENVTLSDAGLYTCVNDDGYGDYFIISLHVAGASATCRSLIQVYRSRVCHHLFYLHTITEHVNLRTATFSTRTLQTLFSYFHNINNFKGLLHHPYLT